MQQGKTVLSKAKGGSEFTHSYASDTKKLLEVAFMLLGDALDRFDKAKVEDMEFCLDYAKFKAKLMATSEDCDTRSYVLNSLLEI
ncbi:hypothetical protein DSO57_1036247 [Entomophthora muscae]|uniref:Uncharacterized protein n=1 Tax=Entomophthora muscae TaxID=34485 RepID=A0ACC2RQA6_9FUNG|nr:hypothetical protein DSO57_1036247 [Entomophthora muscae]